MGFEVAGRCGDADALLRAIAEQLFLSRKTVDSHISQIFLRLDLRESPEDQRRVLAVLTFLRSEDP